MTKNFLYTFLALCILIIIVPLMIPGYIFGLDQALNPNGYIPKVWANIFWVAYLSKAFAVIWIPVWILEKFIIILTFIAPVVWMYLFTKKKKTQNIALLFASLLAIFNPFLYSRFIDGQMNVYLSFALYPLFFYFLLRAIKKWEIKYIISTILWSLLLCLTSLHNAIFIFFIFLALCITHIHKKYFKNILKIWAWIFAVNLLWLIPLILAGTNTFWLVNQVDNFWENNRQAFQTVSPDSNISMSILSMNGYWGENESRFRWFTTINSEWKNIFYILFFLVIVWVFRKLDIQKRNLWLKRYEYSLLILMWVSFVLAHGNQWGNIFAWINNLMYDYFPLYNGMREPQKWVMFLIIWYAYFWAMGLQKISEFLKHFEVQRYIRTALVIFLALIPIIYIPVMFFWLFGQISIQQYPKEWEQAKPYLSETQGCEFAKCYSTLAFPWHAYMSFQFTQKVTGTWALRYFWDDLLFWDNLEIRDIYSTSNRIESKIIEAYIWPKWAFRGILEEDFRSVFTKFTSDIQALWVSQILLLKEVDYVFYEKILRQWVVEWYLEVKYENDMLTIYTIK